MFKKLIRDGNCFEINSKKQFSPMGTFKESTIKNVFDFAFMMSFGNEGEHRRNRSGGTHIRKQGEIFANTFQGKLAECALYNYMKPNNFEMSRPDFSVYKLGKWDDEDLMINGFSISIKSTKSIGQLILLESKDWNLEAEYIPNHKAYDFTFLVRMNPFCEELFRKNRLLYTNEANYKDLEELLLHLNWQYDIPGFVTRDDLVYIISNNFHINKGAILNKRTILDADNYYIQAGDLRPCVDFNKIIRG